MKKFANAIFYLILVFSFIAPIIEVWAFLNFLGTVSDFPEYYCAGKLALTGKAAEAYNIVEMAKSQHQIFGIAGERVVGFYMPPPALLFMAPFALLAPFPSACIWILLQLASLIISILLLRKLCPLSNLYYEWLVLCLNLSGPLYEALRLGQPVGLFLLSVVLSFHFLQKHSCAKAGLALAPLAMKPQLALPVLLIFLALRKFKAVAWSVGSFAAIYACSLFLFSWESFASYAQFAAKGIEGSINTISGGMATYLNPTVRGQLLRITSTSLANNASLGIFGISMALSYFVVRKAATATSAMESVNSESNTLDSQNTKRANGELSIINCLALAIALPIGFVSSLHCHDYDLLLLLPALICASSLEARQACVQSSSKPRSLAQFLLVTIYSLPIFIYFHYSWLLEQKNLLNPFFIALLIYCSVSIWSFTQALVPKKPESQ